MHRKVSLAPVFIISLVIVATFAIRLAAQSAAPSPAQDGTLPALAAIAGQGMMNIHAYQELGQLSDDIGWRVTGSPQCNAAIQWGVETMKKIGLQNVRAEHWQIFRGWTRVSAEAEMVAPAHHHLMVDSMGWVGSTPADGVTSDVVQVNVYQLQKEMQQNFSSWSGKILLAVQKGEPPADRTSTFAEFGTFLVKAHAVGAIAVIGGQGGAKAQGMHLTHTGALGFNTYFDIPVVSISAEDQDILERFLNRGKTPRVHINVQNRATDGPADTANVVGEIPGTTHPEQVIVVGGHLDSWDLAEGSTDDGMGVATTLGAAEAILRSGFKPLRTIRFVLFAGEEQGLLGSFAYVKTHQNEMANHLAAVILDSGQGPVTELNMGGRDDLILAMQQLTSGMRAFGKLEVNDRSSFGTDAGPFILKGLPGINLDQDSPDYRYTHHSPVDTFDKIDEAVLDRDATVQGLIAFWIADRPDRLDTPWPAERMARKLVEQHQDTFLKMFGIWPFGDLGAEPKQ
ncbi:MAG TPA: M20/M25/M40 family metallo-hydrolase [Candidatus Acidoferrales bacterium]|nr:M20/M25/M40 family metallo-hydrolase [Candidatus Acidoferrales bacterium]